MRVSGMAELAGKKYDIYVGSKKEEYVIGKLFLHNGSGEWEKNGEGVLTGTEGMTIGEVERFTIKISDTEVIEGKCQTISVAEKKEADRPQEKKEFHAAEKKEEKKKAVKKESAPEPKKSINREKLGGNREKEIRMEEVILDDKWEQLCKMYPVVHPYEDERKYISIQPKDFVVMTGDYQHLANNSFLLHGFYNYRHIVLGREPVHEEEVGAAEADKNRAWNERQRTERDTGIKEMNGVRNEDAMGDFYLGVPGVYYEREKMVALMFGFEAFECIGGKAESGKFGYYLRRVKI